jgi:hypothetical protein
MKCWVLLKCGEDYRNRELGDREAVTGEDVRK